MSTIDFNGEAAGNGKYIPSDVTFSGTLNGNDHAITGFEVKDNEQIGLFKWLGDNANIKNLKLSVKAISTNNGSVAGTIGGKNVVIENVVIEIEEHAGYAAGGICRNVIANSSLTLKNVMVIVNDSTISNFNGILFGNYGAASTVTVDGLYILDKATGENKIVKLHTDYVTLNGTDGEAAVLGEDYYNVTDKTDLPISEIQGTGLATLLGEDFFG